MSPQHNFTPMIRDHFVIPGADQSQVQDGSNNGMQVYHHRVYEDYSPDQGLHSLMQPTSTLNLSKRHN